MELDFSQQGEPVNPEVLDFSSEGIPVESTLKEEPKQKSNWDDAEFSTANSYEKVKKIITGNLLETQAVANLIAGTPGEVIGAGAKAVADFGNTLKGSKTPAQDSQETFDKFAETKVGKYLLNPITTLIGNEEEVKGTLVSSIFNEVGKSVTNQAKKIEDNNTRAGLMHGLELALSVVGYKGLKGDINLTKPKQASVKTLDELSEDFDAYTLQKEPEQGDLFTNAEAQKIPDPMVTFELDKNLKGKSLEELSKVLSEDEWIAQYKAKNPEKDPEFAAFAYEKLQPEKKVLDDIDNPVSNFIEKGLGTYFARMQSLGPKLHQRAVDVEFELLKTPHDIIKNADEILTASNKKLTKENSALFESAILSKDISKATGILKASGLNELADNFDTSILKPIRDLGEEAVKVGLFSKTKPNYVLPRMVKDYEGMSKELGISKSGETLENALEKAEIKALSEGRAFSELERSNVASKFIRGYPKPEAYKAGYRKERVFDEIPENLKQYYHNFSDSYNKYVSDITRDITIAKFFGKNLKKTETGNMDIEASIGFHAQEMVKEGKLSLSKQKEFQDLIRARFVGGNRSPHAVVQTYKNVVSATLLPSLSSAVKNLFEAFPTIAYSQPEILNGLKASLGAGVQGVLGKQKLHARDFGFIDHISQLELGRSVTQGKGALSKTLNTILNASDTVATKALKTSSFSSFDMISKTGGLNTHFIGGALTLKTAKGRRAFAEEWKPRFGKEYPQLVKDLMTQEVTPVSMRYAFSQLVKGQSVTKGNWTEAMLSSPNAGRVMFTLKSFMVNQMNLYRTEAFNKIKSGNRKEGIQMAAKLATAMYLANATGNQVQNFLMGRDDDAFALSKVPFTMLKSYGASEVAYEDFKKGHIGEAAKKTLLPPTNFLDKPLEDIIKTVRGEDNDKRYLDILPGGKEIRAWGFDGADKWNAENSKKEIKKQLEEYK